CVPPTPNVIACPLSFILYSKHGVELGLGGVKRTFGTVNRGQSSDALLRVYDSLYKKLKCELKRMDNDHNLWG
ncbi:MAG: hypothetical protein IKE41_03060, partial [Clostridia bacterium]|nr:hypothetical protein [Clostridia bacterium]